VIKYLHIILVLSVLGCSDITVNDIEGLWQLEEVEVDKMPMSSGNTFLEISDNNSFAVSRTSGDLSGIYFIKNDRIRMNSQDKQWFNRDWIVDRYQQYLILSAIGPRKTHLKFKKVREIPRFEEFESAIIGKWNLYKIRSGEGIEKLSNTWFDIDSSGEYVISNAEGVLTNGKVVINTRHRKMIFEPDSTIWNAWFYGSELRIDNPKIDIQYSLRKESSP
jgi:hypothetical protein